jgi:hypothetical protein
MIRVDPLRKSGGDAAEEVRLGYGLGLWHKGFELSERSAAGIGKPRFSEIGQYIPN